MFPGHTGHTGPAQLNIRPYTPATMQKLSRFEKLADDSRKAAQSLVPYLEAIPYLKLDPSHCFTITADSPVMLDEIAGYVLCAASTPDFVKDYNEKYVPGLNLPTTPSGAVTDRMREQIKNGDRMLTGLEKNWSAHLHFNIINDWQRYGLGAHLIEKLLEKVKEGIKGVHVRILGYDYPRMADYGRLERFRDLEKAGFREVKSEGSERWFVRDL